MFSEDIVRSAVEDQEFVQLFGRPVSDGGGIDSDAVRAVITVAEGDIEAMFRAAGSTWPPKTPLLPLLESLFVRVFRYHAFLARRKEVPTRVADDYRLVRDMLMTLARQEIGDPLDGDVGPSVHHNIDTLTRDWTDQDLVDELW